MKLVCLEGLPISIFLHLQVSDTKYIQNNTEVFAGFFFLIGYISFHKKGAYPMALQIPWTEKQEFCGKQES